MNTLLLILCLSLHIFLPASEVGGAGDVKRGVAAGEEKKKRDFIVDPNDPINQRFMELLKEFVKVTYYYKTGEAPMPLSEFQKEKEPLFKELLQLLDKGANPNVFDVQLIDRADRGLLIEFRHIKGLLPQDKYYKSSDKLDHTFRRGKKVKVRGQGIEVTLNQSIQQYMLQKIKELTIQLIAHGGSSARSTSFALGFFVDEDASIEQIEALLKLGVHIGWTTFMNAILKKRRDIIQLFLRYPHLFGAQEVDEALGVLIRLLKDENWVRDYWPIFQDILQFSHDHNIAIDMNIINTPFGIIPENLKLAINALLRHGVNYKNVKTDRLDPQGQKIVQEQVQEFETKKAIAEWSGGYKPIALELEQFMFGGEERETVGEVKPDAGDAKSAAAGKS